MHTHSLNLWLHHGSVQQLWALWRHREDFYIWQPAWCCIWPRRGHHHAEAGRQSSSDASTRDPRAPQNPCHGNGRDALGVETTVTGLAGSPPCNWSSGRLLPAEPAHKRGPGPAARVTGTPLRTSPAAAGHSGRASPAQAQEAVATQRPRGLRCRAGRAVAGAKAGKAEHPSERRGGSRASAAAAACWGSGGLGTLSPVPPPRPRRLSGNTRGPLWQEHSPPPLARPLRRRLSPQTTVCRAPAPDAI